MSKRRSFSDFFVIAVTAIFAIVFQIEKKAKTAKVHDVNIVCFSAWETPAYPPSHGQFAAYKMHDLFERINDAVNNVSASRENTKR